MILRNSLPPFPSTSRLLNREAFNLLAPILDGAVIENKMRTVSADQTALHHLRPAGFALHDLTALATFYAYNIN